MNKWQSQDLNLGILSQDPIFFLVVVAILGFELAAYTLSHSTSPFCDLFCFVFR
jgi:hypothetical protein